MDPRGVTLRTEWVPTRLPLAPQEWGGGRGGHLWLHVLTLRSPPPQPALLGPYPYLAVSPCSAPHLGDLKRRAVTGRGTSLALTVSLFCLGYLPLPCL